MLFLPTLVINHGVCLKHHLVEVRSSQTSQTSGAIFLGVIVGVSQVMVTVTWSLAISGT